MRFVNTVEIDFGRQPTLRMLTVHRWLRSLGVQDSQVYGIMPLTQSEAKVVRLKFKEEWDYQSFYDRFNGIQTMQAEDGVIQVTVRQAGLKETFVRLLDVPFETAGDSIKAALQPYGTVVLIRREKYMSSTENDYFHVLTGTVTVKMMLVKNVPSYLRIQDQRILVRYPGQPPTCMICNQPGHLAANCAARRPGPRFIGKWAETVSRPRKNDKNESNPCNEDQDKENNKTWPTPAETANLRHSKSAPTKPQEVECNTQAELIPQQSTEKPDGEHDSRCNAADTPCLAELTSQDLELSLGPGTSKDNPMENRADDERDESERNNSSTDNENSMEIEETTKGGIKRVGPQQMVTSKNKKALRQKKRSPRRQK